MHACMRAAAADALLQMQEVMHAAYTGPTDRVGEVGRLIRRFRKQPDPTTFNLNHALAGVDQASLPGAAPHARMHAYTYMALRCTAS